MLKITLIINFIWSLVMVTWNIYRLLGAYSNSRAVYCSFFILYVIIALFALIKHRWAIVISIIVSILLLIRWVPMVGINYWLYITKAPLYLDSPATIFIVHIIAVVYAFPALLTSLMFLLSSRPILKKIFKANEKSSHV